MRVQSLPFIAVLETIEGNECIAVINDYSTFSEVLLNLFNENSILL